MTGAGGRDSRTRQRILAAATELFATRGYGAVTIREICRAAGANVAAVNYHFHGKLELYEDVLEAAIQALREATDDARRAGEGRPPEERLRAYIRVHCRRMFASSESSWLPQLIQRELNSPTDGLTALLDRALRPRFEYLAAVVRPLLGRRADDERITQCTASVHAQIVAFRPTAILDRLPRKVRRAFAIERVVDHITAFSIAALEGYAATRRRTRTRVAASRRPAPRPRRRRAAHVRRRARA